MKTVSAVVAGALLLAAGVLAGQLGLVSFNGPSLPRFGRVDVDLALPAEARIVAVEPISLDCRARVHARVPVVGTREHEAFGVIYRTDRVTLDAVGDVDTCVDGAGTDVTHHRDGTTEVVIDGGSILFVRPRVDMNATVDSLTVDKGPIGKLTDSLPWVDDNLGLTPLAYAYAQNVIGSSGCTGVAYQVTESILVDAYRQQFIDQGIDPDLLAVRIDGQPRFDELDPVDSGDVALTVGDGDVTCVVDDDVGGAAVPGGV
ncbi:MAG: hypothetical protein ACFCVK_00070 [Acidimicrobiales bacterium]